MKWETFRDQWVRASVFAGTLASILTPVPSEAEMLQVPWECSTYTADAQTRCVNVFMEAQQSTVGQLKDQLDRQSAATTNLQRQLAERPTTSVVPFSYGYPYSYALAPALGLGLGLGLHFGSATFYASPYDRPYWGQRHFGYWGYRW